MIPVVLDSNVWISAVLFGGNPMSVLELAEAGQIALFISDELAAEIEETLSRKFLWSGTRIRDAGSRAWRRANRVETDLALTDCADPDDNRVLECAVTASAQFLVTGDRHLLVMHLYRRIAIVTPRQFLDAAPWVPV